MHILLVQYNCILKVNIQVNFILLDTKAFYANKN